jgi:hypothetical protein
MTFYDLNVTKPIIKSNGTISLNAGGTPNLPRLVLGGVLERIGILTQGTPVMTPGTGSIARDINGGYNIHSNIAVIPNQQVPIYSCSGFGSWLFNNVKDGLELDNFNAYDLQTGVVTKEQGLPDLSYINSSDLITTPAGAQSPLWTIPHFIPIVQRMFNGIVGYWELGNPLAQLTVQLIAAYTGLASPFSIASLTAGQLPYLITGNATVTLATPTADIVRYLWDTPVDPQDRPPVTFINTIIEDTFQNNVGSNNALKYTFAPLSGYVARIVAYVNDSATGKGVAPSLMLPTNSLTFGIGDGTTLISESIYENLSRQKMTLGYDLPQGAFFLDFLGRDLTWQSVFSTYDNANVNLGLNFASNIGANSFGKVVRQMLKPLQYTAK